MDKLTPVPAKRTMQLCQAVIDYMGSKLRGEEITTPSLQTISALAFDIKKELEEENHQVKLMKKVEAKLDAALDNMTEESIKKWYDKRKIKEFEKGKKVRCVKDDKMDEAFNIPEENRWHIGDEFIIKDIEVFPWGTFLFDEEGHNLDVNRAEIVEQDVKKLTPKEIETFIWLELAYSESNTDFFDWLIKNFDIKQKENEN